MEKTNHLSEQQIARCVDAMNNGTYHELDQTIQDHIAHCDICANEITTISSILEEENALTSQIDINEKKKQSPSNKIGMVSWLVAATVILFFGLRFFINPPKPPNNIGQTIPNISDSLPQETSKETHPVKLDSIVVKENPSVKKPVKEEKQKPKEIKIIETSEKDLLAFAQNDQLERLVERFDGSAMRGDDIEVKSPLTVKGKINEISLNWVNPNQQSLIIEFFNNSGEKLFEVETTESFHKPDKINQPGLYYWKLLNEDFDLLFCGKIIAN